MTAENSHEPQPSITAIIHVCAVDGRSMDDAGSSLAGGVCVDGMVGAEVLDDS